MNILQVIFSDEFIFSVAEESSQYVRRTPDEAFSLNCINQKVKHPTSVMVWSCMSVHGCGRLYIVEGTMNQIQYKKVLQTSLIPQIRDWFPDGDCILCTMAHHVIRPGLSRHSWEKTT